MKVLVGTFKKEKVLVGAFSGHCKTSRWIVDSSTDQVAAAGGDEPAGLGLDPGGHPPHPAAGAEAGRGAGAGGRDGDKRGAPQAAVNSANIGTFILGLLKITIGNAFTCTVKAPTRPSP